LTRKEEGKKGERGPSRSKSRRAQRVKGGCAAKKKIRGGIGDDDVEVEKTLGGGIGGGCRGNGGEELSDLRLTDGGRL